MGNDGVARMDVLGQHSNIENVTACQIKIFLGDGPSSSVVDKAIDEKKLTTRIPVKITDPEVMKGGTVPYIIVADKCGAATVVACHARWVCRINHLVPGYPLSNGPMQIYPGLCFAGESYKEQANAAIAAAKVYAASLCDKPCCCPVVTVEAYASGLAIGLLPDVFGVGKSSIKWQYDCSTKKFTIVP